MYVAMMDASLKVSVHTYAIDVELSNPCLALPRFLQRLLKNSLSSSQRERLVASTKDVQGSASADLRDVGPDAVGVAHVITRRLSEYMSGGVEI